MTQYVVLGLIAYINLQKILFNLFEVNVFYCIAENLNFSFSELQEIFG